MGHYYKPVIIAPDGRVLVLSAHDFGSFSKLTEHSWISNKFVNAVYSLIYKSPKRVAWIGDYACDDYNPENEPYARAMPLDAFQKYYDAAWSEDREVLPAAFFSKHDLTILDHCTTGTYLVNHTKRVYIDMAAYIRDCTTSGGHWDGWCMNPLPLLTACGNGRGGGDYGKNHPGCEDIGVWAFDRLEYTDKAPAGYIEAEYYFNEHEGAAA
jgi:hypothetical protein